MEVLVMSAPAGEVPGMSPTRKRPAPEDENVLSGTPFKMAKTTGSTELALTPKKLVDRMEFDEAPDSPLSSVPPMSPPPGFGDFSTTTSATSQKRKKRTPAEVEAERKQKEVEKEARRILAEEKRKQKEEEDRLKAEERRKKAEEAEEKKRLKDLEARQKEQEKEEKRKARELEQQEKDAKKKAREQETQAKLDEQEKKEKAQLRLHNFFAAKPVSKSALPTTSGPSSENPSPAKSAASPQVSEYRKKFLPFAIGSNVTLPRNYFKKQRRQTKPLDCHIKSSEWSLQFPPPKKRGWEQLPVKEIVDRLQSSSGNLIDLTTNQQSGSFSEAVKMARHTSVKYIFFSENVRPAYFGTYTPNLSLANLRKLARNPTMKIEHLSYDYDSEAEWEEEEGDDVASDGEEEEEDLEEDEDEAFIDDTEMGIARAKGPQMFANDLTPVCTGIQWQNGKGDMMSADGVAPSIDLGEMEMEFLLRPYPQTIDPFSTSYWETANPQAPNKPTAPVPGHRPALMDKTKQLNSVTGPNSSKAARYVPDSDLPAFKQAIDGQDLTKIAMIEHLKKLFPKQPKDSIVNTLTVVAERESKKATAKWRLKGT